MINTSVDIPCIWKIHIQHTLSPNHALVSFKVTGTINVIHIIVIIIIIVIVIEHS